MRRRPWEAVPDFFAFTETAAMPFTAEQLAAAPAATGVYFLYRNERVIYIGVAVHGSGIRQELHNHLRGSYGAGTQEATAFRYELTRDPVVAKHEYLRIHQAAYGGRLPACNTPQPAAA
jgi:lipid-binding SYLF domain-containing protein